MTTRLAAIEVEGFLSLKKVELRPGPATVLIGPNGSGKSNLLKFLRMIPLIHTASLQRFVGESGGAASLLHYGPKATREISFRLEFHQDDLVNSYSARLGFAAGDTLLFLDEQVARQRPDEAAPAVFALGAGHRESSLRDAAHDERRPTELAVSRWLSSMSFFHFHDTSRESHLRTLSRSEDSRYLRSNGSNLAAYLLALRESPDEDDRAAWRCINQLVRGIAPFIKELDPVLVGNAARASDTSAVAEGRSVRLDWIDQRDEVFGPHQLSDGTLRAIALITALAQPATKLPRFITIDEPELGLHPAALALLADLIHVVRDRCQVVLATQSPALLDLFEPADVVAVELRNGCTVLGGRP